MGYGPARKLHYLLEFKANRGAPEHRKQTRCVLREQRPISGRARFQDTKSYKENNSSASLSSFSSLSVDVSPSSVCVYPHLGPEGPISVSGLGNMNPIPFRSASRQTRACVLRLADVSLRKRISDPLGPTDPVQLLFTWNPSPASVLKVLT
ncbi:hypothetical protein JTE90_015047 [Oedothorax gibbosus]|uniref:Uncharacterized protein n=1 Tax=Oedothorax gibbosus TaxID=931172 RepID=A0AAV6TMV2_9ARAC|nr:hypothetical protein JTE90_015047 [Oedothorax gibbosus]